MTANLICYIRLFHYNCLAKLFRESGKLRELHFAKYIYILNDF